MLESLVLDLDVELNAERNRLSALGLSTMAYTGAVGFSAPRFFHRSILHGVGGGGGGGGV
jgi:hypothetical protein